MGSKLISLITILVMGVLIFGCTSSNSATSINAKVVSNDTQVNLDCPKLLLTDNFNVMDFGEFITLSDRNILEKGYAFLETTNFECNRGINEGENTNYVYCKNMYVEKTIVDSQGKITKKENYWVDFIYSTEDASKTKLIQSSCQSAS